jgi:hypothetical protein
MAIKVWEEVDVVAVCLAIIKKVMLDRLVKVLFPDTIKEGYESGILSL